MNCELANIDLSSTAKYIFRCSVSLGTQQSLLSYKLLYPDYYSI